MEYAVWNNLAYEVLRIVFLALASLAVQALATYLKRKGIIEAIVAKEELAMIAVQFVEQAYQEFEGPEKFSAAMDYLSYSLGKYGFKVSPQELEALIESAVLEMKDAWLEVVEEE